MCTYARGVTQNDVQVLLYLVQKKYLEVRKYGSTVQQICQRIDVLVLKLVFPQSAVKMSHANKYSLGQPISLGLLHKL